MTECKRFAKAMIKKHLDITIPMTKMILIKGRVKYLFSDYAIVEDTRTGIRYHTTSKWIKIIK